MAGRKRSHSESRWALLPPTVIRCNATRPDGSRCKREAEAGSGGTWEPLSDPWYLMDMVIDGTPDLTGPVKNP
jgi:hypothetical protein